LSGKDHAYPAASALSMNFSSLAVPVLPPFSVMIDPSSGYKRMTRRQAGISSSGGKDVLPAGSCISCS
jgi:hypothetical protein